MEFHCSLGDIELCRDFLIGAVAKHRVEYFLLAATKRCGAGGSPPDIQKFLRAGNQVGDPRLLSGNQHHEIARGFSTNETLHGEQTRRPLQI